jgi:hypothetical protein
VHDVRVGFERRSYDYAQFLDPVSLAGGGPKTSRITDPGYLDTVQASVALRSVK